WLDAAAGRGGASMLAVQTLGLALQRRAFDRLRCGLKSASPRFLRDGPALSQEFRVGLVSQFVLSGSGHSSRIEIQILQLEPSRALSRKKAPIEGYGCFKTVDELLLRLRCRLFECDRFQRADLRHDAQEGCQRFIKRTGFSVVFAPFFFVAL